MSAAMLRRAGVVALGLAAAAVVTFRYLPPYPAVDPRPGPYPAEKLAEEIDPWLLGDGFSASTVVSIDWVEGCKPEPETIAALVSILKKYSAPGRTCLIAMGGEIPIDRWSKGGGFESIARQLAAATPSDGVEQRYVLFVPDLGRYFGHTFAIRVERGGLSTPVAGLVVSRNAHRRYAKLWIRLDHLEAMTLIHEFGHLLGLVGNPHHERRESSRRGHCTSLRCAMAHPTPRVIARNFLAGVFNRFITDYCDDCQSDIRRAQAYWRQAGDAYRDRRKLERAAVTAS